MRLHSFKPHEWPEWVTPKRIRGYTDMYLRDFGNKWDRYKIIHFFELFPELYFEDIPQEHHFRYMMTVLDVGGS